jgi:hypothetical protein
MEYYCYDLVINILNIDKEHTKYHCLIFIVLMILLYYSMIFFKLNEKLSVNISHVSSITDSSKK